MKKLLFFLLMTFLVGCSNVSIKHVSQVRKFNKNHFVYALPKTKLIVHIQFEKQFYKKGPYAEFATKFLGIDLLPTNDNVKYFISKIEVDQRTIADSQEVYVVQYKHQLPWKSIVQQTDGVILSINQDVSNKDYAEKQVFNNLNQIKTFEQVVFKELTPSPYIKERIDTTFKQVKVDTNWVKIMVTKKMIDTLKIEDKAKEAAQHIFEIRTRLFDLMTGDMETLPQGEAAKTILEYLKAEEQEYLSLFMGKTFAIPIDYYIEILPNNINENEIILGYFHPNKGLVNQPLKNAQKFTVKLVNNDYYQSYTQALLKYKKAQNTNNFTYRLPINSTINIFLDENLIYSKQVEIYQWGKVMECPIRMLKNAAFDFSNPLKVVKK
ncbi:MAG: DUF4831 family protein [Bacteroidales bacterium]|nr:DUF4831 family protein [Bacteroidales bacterium]